MSPFLHTTRTVDTVVPRCDYCGVLYGYGPQQANGVALDVGPGVAVALAKAGWCVIGELVVCWECARKNHACPRCQRSLAFGGAS